MTNCPFKISSQGHIEVDTQALINSPEFKQQLNQAKRLVASGTIEIADRGERK